MTLPFARRTLLAAPFALVPGCAAGPVQPTELDAAALAERTRRPELYTNGEARAFLVRRDGVAHGLLWGGWYRGVDYRITQPPVDGLGPELPGQVASRLKKSGRLCIQFSLTQPPATQVSALQQHARYVFATSDPAAIARLDPATRQELKAAGIGDEALSKMSLVGAVFRITGAATGDLPDTVPGVGFWDVEAMQIAFRAGVPVVGLEPISALESSDQALIEPNGPAAEAALRLALRRRTGLRDFIAWRNAHYEAGNLSTLLAGATAWRADPADLARMDARRSNLLIERNRSWIPRLEQEFARPDLTFVAVAATNLLGRDGIVTLLRDRGWTVEACVGDQIPLD